MSVRLLCKTALSLGKEAREASKDAAAEAKEAAKEAAKVFGTDAAKVFGTDAAEKLSQPLTKMADVLEECKCARHAGALLPRLRPSLRLSLTHRARSRLDAGIVAC